MNQTWPPTGDVSPSGDLSWTENRLSFVSRTRLGWPRLPQAGREEFVIPPNQSEIRGELLVLP